MLNLRKIIISRLLPFTSVFFIHVCVCACVRACVCVRVCTGTRVPYRNGFSEDKQKTPTDIDIQDTKQCLNLRLEITAHT